jgi:riboflavin kinase/FMN adenylyltransferase
LIAFQGIDFYTTNRKTVVTIGTFDGVHKGHQQIIRHLVETAKQENCSSLILTFFPHPRLVLQGDSSIQLLNTIEERKALLSKTGVDHLIVHPFDEAFSSMTAEEFIESVLVKKLNVQQIIVGHDHRFGKNRTADFHDLVAFGKKYDFHVTQIAAEMLNEVNISSTKIRAALQEGDIQLANSYLGHPYQLNGQVQKGNQLGRTIGFPTANLAVAEAYKLIPKKGVYLVQSVLNQKKVFGLMNIGVRPTVDGKTQTIEVFYLDFEGDLYGQQLQVELLDFIRDEQKFESLDALKIQLEKDKNWAVQAISAQQELTK